MTLLSSGQQDALTEHVQQLLATCFPVMSYGASGTVAVDVVNSLYSEIIVCISRTFALYAKERNKLLAVSRLPAVLLRKAARLVSTADLERAMRVCTKWRGDLETHTELWKDITLTIGWSAIHQPTELRHVLRRADNQPAHLTLHCWSQATDSPQLLSLLTPALFHLRSLALDVQALEGSFWETLLCSPAPLLEVLKLRSIPNGDTVDQKLPSNLFNGAAPRFKELVLSHIGLPSGPAECPALKNVTTLRILKISFLRLPDLDNTLRRCPNLQHLMLDAISGQAGDISAPIPQLASLRVAVMVWPGCMDLLARRLHPETGQLHIMWPRPVCLEEALSQLRRPAYNELVVRWMRANDDPTRLYLSLTSRADTGAEHGVHLVEHGRGERQLKASRGTLRCVHKLTIPDMVWLSIVDDPPRFNHLRSLTVSLAPAANVLVPGSYTHLFVLQQVPLASFCPVLEDVCLMRDALRPGSCDFVRVVAIYVAQWLPPTVKRLVLRGVKLIGPGIEVLQAQVESVQVQPTDGDLEAATQEMERWVWE